MAGSPRRSAISVPSAHGVHALSRTDGGVSQPSHGHLWLHLHSQLVEEQTQGLPSQVPGEESLRSRPWRGSLLGELRACSCSFSVVFPPQQISPGVAGSSCPCRGHCSVPPVWTAAWCRTSSPTVLWRCCDMGLLKYPTCPCYHLFFCLYPGISTSGRCSSCFSLPAWPQPAPQAPGVAQGRAGQGGNSP